MSHSRLRSLLLARRRVLVTAALLVYLEVAWDPTFLRMVAQEQRQRDKLYSEEDVCRVQHGMVSSDVRDVSGTAIGTK